MTRYRYLDSKGAVIEERDFVTEHDAEEHRLSVIGAEVIEKVDPDADAG